MRPAALVGGADTTADYKTNEKNGARLAADAVLLALENVGLPKSALKEADGLFCVPTLSVTVEFPVAVAQCLETPFRLTQSFTNGGSSPIEAVTAASRLIGSGHADFIIVCGGENMGSFRCTNFGVYMSAMQILLASLYNKREMDHYAAIFSATYAVYGIAHAAKEKMPLADLQRSYAEMVAAFSRVASDYAPARSKGAVEAQEVLDSGPIATPFTKLMCANPRVDQGTALLVMSDEKAEALGIGRERRVYFHGGGSFTDHKSVEEEKDFTRMWAANIALLEALAQAGIPLADLEKHVETFDIYSCFPSVVHGVTDMLGMDFSRDPGRFTTAGGLARRGGAGSLYALSSLYAMHERLVENGGKGLAYGLGGASSSHSAIVLGAEPSTPTPGKPDSDDLAKTLSEYNAIPRAVVDPDPSGEAIIKTYTVIYENQLKGANHAPYAVCIAGGASGQFVANLIGIEPAELAEMNPADIVGKTCKIARTEKGLINVLLN